jgi:sulfonate transport system substrate-binding protein
VGSSAAPASVSAADSAKPGAGTSEAATAKPSGAATSGKPAAASSTKPSRLAKVVSAYSNAGMGHLQDWIGEDAGIFQKNGLDVLDQKVGNSTAVMASLLSGQTDVGQSGGSDAVSADASGADVVIISVLIPVYSYLLEVPKAVTSVDQLKGKKVGVDAYGSAGEIGVRVALNKLGLNPDKDVSIVAVGDIPTRAAALLQGAIVATVLNPPASLDVESKGFHPLISLPEQKLPASTQSTIVQRSWLNAHRDLAQRYIDSIVEANTMARQNKQFTLDLMRKRMYQDTTNDAVMTAVYDFYIGQIFPPAPFPRPDMLQDSLTELASKNAAVKNIDPAKIVDPSLVQSAVDRGLAPAS